MPAYADAYPDRYPSDGTYTCLYPDWYPADAAGSLVLDSPVRGIIGTDWPG